MFSLFPAANVEAKEWRGITPLQSTRADVTRLLGKSPDANHIRANYYLEEGHIYIVFSNQEKYFADCVKKLPVDTVLLIQFTPKKELSLSDLKFDLSKFNKFDPSEPKDIGFEGYINNDEGLVIRTFKGKVEQIDYFATPQDRKLCPEYYSNPESFVQIMVCGLPAQ